jgi:hypothetical protein
MYAPPMTPSIEVTIGRETRLYHAFITTAPLRFDAPATVTLHTGTLSDISGMAANPISLDGRASVSARLVLVDGTELAWQRARYRERGYLCAPGDPVLVGVNTLQHWLWNRIAAPHPGLEVAQA